MGLDDFERELQQTPSRHDEGHRRHRHRSRDRDDRHHHRHHHHHHHRSHRPRDDDGDRERSHRRRRHRDEGDGRGEDSERRKRHRDRDDDGRTQRKRHRSDPPQGDQQPEPTADHALKAFDSDGEDEWVEKEAATVPPGENMPDQRGQDQKSATVQRDAWMQEPSALDMDYVSRKTPRAPRSQFVAATQNDEFTVQEQHVNQHLADLARDFDSDGGDDRAAGNVEHEPAQHEVNYKFGDGGSTWRMTKLKGVYRKAQESGKNVDDVALETYGDLRLFDHAREEEREVDRREMYGKDHVGLEKPSGELFQERTMHAGMRRGEQIDNEPEMISSTQGQTMAENLAPSTAAPLDLTALNKLKARLMKARLKKAPNLAQLEEEYNAAEAASLAHKARPDVIVLNDAENRMLAGGRSGEVTAVSGRRARERGTVVENEDMSIEDMVKQEKRTRGMAGGEGRQFAERIAKDGRFKDDLDYMDDNAHNLSKKVIKSDRSLGHAAVGEFQRMQRILENCPLCYHEESNTPPTAPVISLATRTYMTLPTQPELAADGAVIVPIQHRLNLLECDDDEWEEMRNFMKSLTRFYHTTHHQSVLFYENAAHMHRRRGHAALHAVPLPHHLAESAPAYFREAILAAAQPWSQHPPLIDTRAPLPRHPPPHGNRAFRAAMVKELPYFHVFFTLDGGVGHVVEDDGRWPPGDLFAREVLGAMLHRPPELVRKQGRWHRHDARLHAFRDKWGPFDWTKLLVDAGPS